MEPPPGLLLVSNRTSPAVPSLHLNTARSTTTNVNTLALALPLLVIVYAFCHLLSYECGEPDEVVNDKRDLFGIRGEAGG